MWGLRGLFLMLCASAQLIFLAEVTRHGARVASRLYPFNLQYWKESQLKELTEVGLKQHYDLGIQMRRNYPTFFEKYDRSTFDCLTSPYTRAVYSAYAHLAGLYPDGPEWLKKYDGSGDPSRVYETLHDFPSDTPVMIAEGADLFAVRGHDPIVCPRVKQLKKEMEASEEYRAQESFWNYTFFPALSEATDLPISSIAEVNALGSVIQCEEAAGRDPLKLEADMLAMVYKVRTFKMNYVPFSSTEAQSLASSGFFTRLTRQVEGALHGSGLKYAFYSAHDYTLLALLNALDAKKKFMPLFADSLVIEVYADETIKLLYNRVPLLLEGCNGTCSWSKLREIMERKTIPDLEKACQKQ
jgi:hypothetical protein